ncbi:hypothetical protein FOZ61_000194 [Perkinsus olseni]|uniref:C3H1-type domain-containing protein n=1 Tax=Perkinsus olseni TaxID=32597 RepID=A0A7J6KTZ0_PEROL|nr:hypothetical protein FOZ61_000194 [Perkinsus olseni]
MAQRRDEQQIVQPDQLALGAAAGDDGDNRVENNDGESVVSQEHVVVNADENDGGNVEPRNAEAEAAAEALRNLPYKAAEFLRQNATLSAQRDIASCLVRLGVTNEVLLRDLHGACDEVARELDQPANAVALRSLARHYAADSSARGHKRKRASTEVDEDTLPVLQREFEAIHGMRVPGRYLLGATAFGKLSKKQMVQLSECGMVSRSGQSEDLLLRFNKLTGELSSGVTESRESTADNPSCQSADFFFRLGRWLLTASLLKLASPLEGLLYLTRVAEMGRASGLGASSCDEPWGKQLAQGHHDILSRHGQAGKIAIALSRSVTNGRGSSHSSKPSTSRSSSDWRSDDICRLFQRGKCHYGDNCKFRHRGKCHYGDNCKFRHVKQRFEGRQGKKNGSDVKQEDTGRGNDRSRPNVALRDAVKQYASLLDFCSPPSLGDKSRPASSSALATPSDNECELHAADCLERARKHISESLEQLTFVKDGAFGYTSDSEPPLTAAQKAVGEKIGEIIWAESSANGFTEAFEAVSGTPTAEQVARLEETSQAAATKARKTISELLGVEPGKRDNGGRIYCGLLDALVRKLGVPDVALSSILRVGVPIGISKEVPPCPLYPPYDPKRYDPYPASENRNYKSMDHPDVVGAVDRMIAEEVEAGYLRVLDDVQAADPSRTYVSRGAIPKGETYRSGVRLRTKVGSLLDRWPHEIYRALKLDLRSAYRAIAVHPAERKHLSFRHVGEDGRQRSYENVTLPFGLACSAYWFVRFATVGQQCITVVVRAFTAALLVAKESSKSGSLTEQGAFPGTGVQYVDDGFWCLASCIYTRASVIICLLWIIIGPEMSFPKLRANVEAETCMGVTVDVSHNASSRLEPKKLDTIVGLLDGLRESERITDKDLSRLAGKLSNWAQLRRYIRPFLQPYFGLLSVLRAKGLRYAKCPPSSEIGVVSGFLKDLALGRQSLRPVGPLRRVSLAKQPTIVVVVDASTEALGGFVTLSLGESAANTTCWFRLELSTSSLGKWCCLLKDSGLPAESRNIVAFELLSACLGLKVRLRRQAGRDGVCERTVAVLTDNESTRAILAKIYAKTAGLAMLMRRMVSTLSNLTDGNFFPMRIATADNKVADDISRGCAKALPPDWERVAVDLEEI